MDETVRDERILQQIRERGQERYFGWAIRSVKRLEAQGLVTIEWQRVPLYPGSELYCWQATARPRA